MNTEKTWGLVFDIEQKNVCAQFAHLWANGQMKFGVLLAGVHATQRQLGVATKDLWDGEDNWAVVGYRSCR